MNPLYQKHIISINDLSREELELVLETAAKLKANPQPELLKHKVIGELLLRSVDPHPPLLRNLHAPPRRERGGVFRQQQHLAG